MSLLKTSELSGLINRVLKQVGRRRKDNNYQYFCPFCNHAKRKLEIRMEEPFQWNCWVCGTKGRGIYWLFKKLKVGSKEISELEKIVGSPKSRDNIDLEDPDVINLSLLDDKKPEEAESLSFPGEFKSLMDNDGSYAYNRAMNYAKKRKITIADIEKYNIGYCDKGHLKDRIVFPSYDKNNTLNFYSCRSYFDDTFLKYINSEVSKDIIGFENLINFDYPIYLCEGALDAISLKRNAIPLFGKTMSHKLKTAIVTNKCPEIDVVLDDDALESAVKIAEYLLSYGKKVKLVRLSGKDPNVLGFQKTIEQVKNTQYLDFSSLTMIKLGL